MYTLLVNYKFASSVVVPNDRIHRGAGEHHSSHDLTNTFEKHALRCNSLDAFLRNEETFLLASLPLPYEVMSSLCAESPVSLFFWLRDQVLCETMSQLSFA
jgi:hypothetical protein